jgi:hypothetical protein
MCSVSQLSCKIRKDILKIKVNSKISCHDIKTANISFENVAQNKYLGTTVTNQNLIREEIVRRLKAGNFCYHSVQNLFFLPSRLLSKSVNIIIYISIILPVVLYGCDTCSLTLRVEHRHRVFQNRVLMRMFRPNRDEVTGGKRKLHKEKLHTVLFAKND